MPDLQVTVMLPYYLGLAEGDYPTDQVGDVVQIVDPPSLDGTAPRTLARARFRPDDNAHPLEIDNQRTRYCHQLVLRINRLLRWYRSVSRRADITEVTRAGKPFSF